MAERARRLIKLLDGIIGGRQPISVQNAPQFLEAICAQADAASCLSKIIGSQRGISSIQSAMRFDLSPRFMNGLASNFLRYIRAPELHTIGNGSFLRQIIVAIVEPPIFWDAFVSAFRDGVLQENGQVSFAWLLHELVSLPVEKAGPYREIAGDQAILDRLVSSPHPETSSIASRIKRILSTFISTAPADSDYQPGGRHDNDFADYRSISIHPTAEEILSNERPFLRPSFFLEDPDSQEARLATHLDNQFRLLREDMIYELRDELHIALRKKKGKLRGLVIDGLKLDGMHCGAENNRTRWALALECIHDLPPLAKKSKFQDRKAYLAKEGRHVCRHQALACLIVDDDEVVAFPTISRNEDLLARQPPVVLLCFAGEASIKRTLLRLKTAKRIKLIQINTAVFSYEPVLRALQEMTNVPLSDELLSWTEESEITTPASQPETIVQSLRENPRQDLRGVLGIMQLKPIELDESQAASLQSALTQRVSLIQGPPGTGKSFIGALLAKALHDNDQKILVVCYTNHALDQFLEDLLNIGIPENSIVRLGSKSTARTASLTLQQRGRVYRMSRTEWGEVDQLKEAAERLAKHLEDTFTRYVSATVSLGEMLEYLEFEYPEYCEAFTVPQSMDGMTLVKKGGKAVDKLYLLSQWVRGFHAGIFRNHAVVRDAASIWNMPHAARKNVIQKWRQEILKEQIAEIYETGVAYHEKLSEIERRLGQNTAVVLRSKKIIACTTTAAAKYGEDIQAAAPNVLLVEEAGEILESHILTALGKQTDQLILIGDHQQLRPKVQNYLLTVEKNLGYDLNRSLFERLVLKGYPHQTLSSQHRMRPEISALIRHLTYPALIDADDTKQRPNLRGMQSNIVFINHAHPEDEHAHTDPGDVSDVYASSSKRNTYEAEMVLKIVRYLAQQGYGTDKLVVLTPYLGQLFLLQEKLREETDPVLNDLDSFDLVRAGLIPEATAELAKKPLRLATIDNYQGEESDIVICNLTRSNVDHDIGFMSSPQRLNVLLSRARNALIILGNAETFMNPRKGGETWNQLFDLLKKGAHVFDGLPVRCERHPQRAALLKNPIDFDNLVPDGGCQEPCNAMLSCNIHTCPSKCHQLSDHSKMQCDKVLVDTCPKGHKLSWKCHQTKPPLCKKCEKDAKEDDERRQREFALKQKRDAEDQAHAKELQKIEDEIEQERQRIRDAQLAEERANALWQKQRDLQAMREMAARASTQARPATPSPAASSSNEPAPKASSTGATPKTDSKVKAASKAAVPPSQEADNPTAPAEPDASDDDTDDQTPTFESPSEQEWERQKSIEGASNQYIDELMRMTGLEDVKAQILQIKAKIDVASLQGMPLANERFNVVFLGNPGTGKTTVARLYAKILAYLKVIPGITFVETTGSRLANDGVNGTKKAVENIINSGGGALFVDEAYQLTGENNFQGSQVLDFLLAEMENNVGKIVFILAGYSKQMEKFFEHNPGLTSRVPYSLKFADYTDDELRLMLQRLVEKRWKGKMQFQRGAHGLYARIAVRRLGRGRGREGFGNARALENMLAKITGHQADRLASERKKGQNPDVFLLTKEDLIGPDPSKVMLESDAWKELQSLIGLETVKDSIRSLFDRIAQNYRRELVEKEPIQVSLNRVFIGSPGTGKTTVAKLYGQILADLGMLSNGEVIVKNPADFVGSVLGESEKNTKAILAATMGKVLVIDEAYMLYGGAGSAGGGKQSDPYKTAVIDTIVAEVQSTPGEDRCVLLLGYKEQIMEMFQNVNPGLSRRFAIENAFQFEDYSDADLRKILDKKLKGQQLQATDAAKNVAIQVLSRARNRPNFGNAGEVENILGQAKARFQQRQSALPVERRPFDVLFEPQDFDPEFDRDARASMNLKKLFEDVIGCEAIVEKLGRFQDTARKMKARGMDPRQEIPTNFIMKGPPGTGKTTTARKLGQVFYDMGFLSSIEVIECSASDLVGQYVGQTGPKTKSLLEKALGRVLFIDEAYRLGDGPFAKEAIDELVSLLTNPQFYKKIVVILAGYDQDMNRLLAINSGLSSRFSEEIVFPNMTSERCLEVLKAELGKKQIRCRALDDMASKGYAAMVQSIGELSALPSWGNARDVITLSKRMVSCVFDRLADDEDENGELELIQEDVITCMRELLKERRERNVNVPRDPASAYFDQLKQQQQQMPGAAPPPPSIRTAQAHRTESVAPKPAQEQEEEQSTEDGRDAGVTEETWRQLQMDKLAQEQEKQRAKEEVARLEREMEETKRREEALRQVMKKLAEARAKSAAEEDERRRKLEAARLKEIEARAERERREAALRAVREAEEKRRRQEAQVQMKLRQMGVCVAGFQWIKQASGYRCAGGSHFVGNGSLGI
ncbi:P-loop containing nucleoside triphosphate hydrolase protein [Laetiporus sulphureus 93-53]|uniref:p-loop containing nucleoside triphosphate hydrolase protein n=1 Tax=Laetiporus sulphureus 93-53 TaxID=1314785 RepID=A0A165B6H2_9APHY|nr:P-loop containing nucleoside triphosphate hydrolase protein [Laetiporus sulphureus 93-53]KZT00352.1 P-loop containing nucleoside triphosphate hydrolase protein [Laetiporus sulphureus 93-53]